ncbi:hypothetical protein RN001_015406 [Aquatica leii]|uniref:Uncharacterized protein n=1 Tax=Aquatica leii TaxID=1421715 RepID=A0AAN7SC15_9COLE|nr:hypothetical protein RN001_015406 [Aquatica leii]
MYHNLKILLCVMLPEGVVSLFVVGDVMEDALFKCAVQYAEHGLHVWFVSPQPFNKLPQSATRLSQDILRLITFLYLKEESDLLTHLNRVHLWHKYPQVIIINSFETYCKDNALMNAFIVSSAFDAVSSCARRHSLKKAHLVIASRETYHNLTDMYFPRVFAFTNDDEFIGLVKNDVT